MGRGGVLVADRTVRAGPDGPERLAAFERHYPWIDRQGLTYFRHRVTPAPRDGEHALRVVTEYCRSPDEQAAALAALSFECDVLWSVLDAIERSFADGA